MTSDNQSGETLESHAVQKPREARASLFTHYVRNPLLGLMFDLGGGIMRADGCQFIIPKDMSTIGWRGACVSGGAYEADERALIRKFLRPEDTVLELGACLGVVSCVTNQLLRDRSRHVVVEANPLLIPWLFRNREMNHSGFLVEHCAVGKPPEVTFYIHATAVVDGSSQRKSARPVRLPCRSLAELQQRYGPFSTLIMDIEGSEFDVLEDSPALLQNYRLAVIEFHEHIIGEKKTARCKEILSAAGLKLAGKTGYTEAWQKG
jgi:FkbM family methyltransferase